MALVIWLLSGELLASVPLVGGLGLLAGLLLGGFMWLLAEWTYQKRLAGTGEIYIGPKGALNAGTYHPWTGFGVRLEEVRLSEGEPVEVIFTIRVQAGNNSSTNDVHIPVPRGREQEAAELVSGFYAG